jgi:hypothetical protein
MRTRILPGANVITRAPRAARLVLAVVLAGAGGGCADFVTVDNPNVVNEDGIDPVRDADVLSRSAFQDFATANGDLILHSAWLTTELWVGDSSEDRNQFGRREVIDANARLNTDLWQRFARGLATSENVGDLLGAAAEAPRLSLARVRLAAGFTYLNMSEAFCQGVARGGPPLDRAAMLAQAAERLADARTAGLAAGGAEGGQIATAAAVGLARTHLNAGRRAEAAQAAALVPAGFEFLLYNIDDAANRARLGNKLYEATVDRAAAVVPPVYRAMADGGDTRIRYRDRGVNAYDGFLRFFSQEKYASWAAPYRLASGLEARYLAVEARNEPAEMLAFVNERRAAGSQAAITPGTPAQMLAALMEQKSRDFWLEGRRIGDWRRNGDAVPNVIAAGSAYYKPASGPVRDGRCIPLPLAETSNNPNF